MKGIIKKKAKEQVVKTAKKLAVKTAKKKAKSTAVNAVKKAFVTFITSTLILAMSIMASADVLWEPEGNSFFNHHFGDTDRDGHPYVVPEGSSVTMYKSPESGGEIATYESGAVLHIEYTIDFKKETWGIGYYNAQGTSNDSYNEGWVRMARLQLQYDNSLFMSEHSQEFTEYQGELEKLELAADEFIYSYTYPGSGQIDRFFNTEELNDGLRCGQVYTDSDGGKWGYVGYFRGRAGWIYLTDPKTEETPVFNYQVSDTVTEKGSEKAPSALGGGLISTVLMVAGVVLITVGLIGQKKKKKS